MFFRKQKFNKKQLKLNKFIFDVKQLKISEFTFDVKQLKMDRFIKSISDLIISTSNITLEVPLLHPWKPRVPSGVWTKNLPVLIAMFQLAWPLPQLLKLIGYLIRNIFMENVYRKPAVKTSSVHLFGFGNSPKQPTHVWDIRK